MAQLVLGQRELVIKLVYYGPALSGKTTNLRKLHARVEAQSRGRLLSLDTHTDRTLFFDLLPLHFRAADATVRLKVYTVPGQPIHNPTRKIVLGGADGVAFIADSRISETAANNDAFAGLNENLRDLGMDPDEMPIVVQFNKRDLPDVRPDDELSLIAARGGRPVFRATAVRDEGVLHTFFGLARVTWDRLERIYGLHETLGLGRDDFLQQLGALFGKRP